MNCIKELAEIFIHKKIEEAMKQLDSNQTFKEASLELWQNRVDLLENTQNKEMVENYFDSSNDLEWMIYKEIYCKGLLDGIQKSENSNKII